MICLFCVLWVSGFYLYPQKIRVEVQLSEPWTVVCRLLAIIRRV